MDRLLTLCGEWRAGTLSGAIGERLGVTKNAVMGKVHRLCERGILDWRPDPRLARIATPKRQHERTVEQSRRERRARGDELDHRAPVRATLPPLPSVVSEPPAAAKRMAPLALNRPLAPKPAGGVLHPPSPKPFGRIVSCCWPVGTPGTRSFHFCDVPSEPGRPYCEPHAKEAYLPVRGHASPQAGTGALLSGAGP